MKLRTVIYRVLKKPQTLQHSTSVVVQGEPSAIWRTLVEPETSLQTDPSVVAAGRWGAARGLGEVQCFMHRLEDGQAALSALEVVQYEHERRAVTRGLTHGLQGVFETTLEPVGPGSFRVTLRSWQTLPAGTLAVAVKQIDRTLRQHIESNARGYARVFASPADVI